MKGRRVPWLRDLLGCDVMLPVWYLLKVFIAAANGKNVQAEGWLFLISCQNSYHLHVQSS